MSVMTNIPKTTGNAVNKITNRRSIGFITAHIRRNVHPVIKVPPIPIINFISRSGLKSGLPVRKENNDGENNPIAHKASANIPRKYGILIKMNLVL